MRTEEKSLLPRNMAYSLIFSAAAVMVFGSAFHAKAGWLDKGFDLLRGGETEKTVTTRNMLPAADITEGLKEALRVGTETVVNQLGVTDGFNRDANVHIPLPESLRSVKTALEKVGMSSLLDDLELRLNRAAEAATPKAKKLFWEAVAKMTFEDAQKIYNGPDDAATGYFREKLSLPLKNEMYPVIESSLSEVGAIQAFDNVMGQYRSLPFVPDVKADLAGYVSEKGLDGIFHYLAKEEAAIRKDPVKQTTNLLKRVFGGQK